MGWLKTLCEDTGAGSFEALAQALLDAGYQGRGPRPVHNPRSVANTLRAVDAGRADLTDALSRALAEALGLDEAEVVETAAAEGAPRPAAPARVEVPGTPFALDATRDPLPPGYPPEALDPRRWDRHWWDTSALLDAEPQLVTDWLAARYPGVRAFHAATLADALPTLPERGAVALRLDEVRGDEEELAATLPRHLAVLVLAPAAPGAAPTAAEAPEGRDTSPTPPGAAPERRWTPVRPGAFDLAPLVAWFAARVAAGGGFDAEQALALFATPRFSGAATTPGRAVALCQAVDAFGAHRLRQWSGLELLERLLRERPEGGAARLLGPRPWDAVAALVGALAQRPCGLMAPFGPEALAAVASPPAPDLLWRAADDAGTTDAELGAQLRLLRGPGPERVAAALARLGWLTRCAPAAWQLAPHWLLPEVLAELVDGWIDRDGEALGRALLAHDVAPVALARLFARSAAGDLRPLRDAVDALGDGTDPARVARLEGALRAVGLAALAPPSAAWVAELRALAARIAAVARPPQRRGGPLVAWRAPATAWLDPDVFRLATRALGWVLRTTPPTPLDRDLLVLPVELGLRALAGEPELAHRVLRFAARELAGASWLFTPSAVLRFVLEAVDAAADGRPTGHGVHEALTLGAEVAPLAELLAAHAAQRGVDPASVYRALWAWDDGAAAQAPEARLVAWLDAPDALRAALVATVPAERVAEVAAVLPLLPRWPAQLPDAVWPAVVARAVDRGGWGVGFAADEAVWREMPAAMVGEVVASGAFSASPPDDALRARFAHEAARALWARFPDEATAALEALASPERAEVLLATAPESARAALLPALVARATTPGPGHYPVERWARRWVLERVAGWEAAWRALSFAAGPAPASAVDPTALGD